MNNDDTKPLWIILQMNVKIQMNVKLKVDYKISDLFLFSIN